MNRYFQRLRRDPLATAAIVEDETRTLNIFTLTLLALLLGLVTGVGAVVFRELINILHNLFFAGRFSLDYDANVFTPPSRWGAFIILAPVVGGLIVTFLVSNFAPEAKGHGVPEVMDAIYYKEGRIRPIVALVKSVASAFAIGSGSSVGREGPIIQIGSAIGSTLGQIVVMPPGQRITLVAAGAGAGIASTFNTPIGGVMFAIELMLPEVSVDTFLPVAVATGAATFVGRWFLGDQPAFHVPTIVAMTPHANTVSLLVLYAVLGAIVGVAAAGFVRGLHVVEDAFDAIPWRYARHAFGMLLVGLMIYVLMRSLGQYYVDGVGYGTIQSLLDGGTSTAWLLGLLFLCKALATATSLGSGSSGGIFSPSLFMGATLGGGFASALTQAGLPLPLSIPAFAMVGMGAMVGGGTGAVMTAVTMIFEMTRDYDIVMPSILAVAASVGVRRWLSTESIYSLKLVRRGRALPKALHANMFLVRHAREIMDSNVLVLPSTITFDSLLIDHATESQFHHVVVTKEGRPFGVIRINAALWRGREGARNFLTLGDLASRDFTFAREDAVAFDVIDRMWRKGAFMAIVVKGSGVPRDTDVVGVVTKEHIADSVASSMKIYPNR